MALVGSKRLHSRSWVRTSVWKKTDGWRPMPTFARPMRLRRPSPVVDRFGGVDALVHVVGGYHGGESVVDVRDAEVGAMLSASISGPR